MQNLPLLIIFLITDCTMLEAVSSIISTHFTATYGYCSTIAPSTSKSSQSVLQCLAFGLRYSSCIAVDWVHTKGHLGECKLYGNSTEISKLRADNKCKHYRRKNLDIKPKYHDCRSWYEAGMRETGVYKLMLDNVGQVPVYCVMDATSGGWTVFHRRFDGSLNFNQNWTTYRKGFGDVSGEHWLGFEKMIEIMKYHGNHELRIELERFSGETGTAMYSRFNIDGDLYKLTVSGYKGNVGDGLTLHDQMSFSTYDMDNDKNSEKSCAKEYSSGWWYETCIRANLNGKYYGERVLNNPKTMCWRAWGDRYESLKKAQMMFRKSSKVVVSASGP